MLLKYPGSNSVATHCKHTAPPEFLPEHQDAPPPTSPVPLLALRWWVSFLFELLALIFYHYAGSLAQTEELPTDQLPNDNTIYALVIGINVYQLQSSEWPALKAAVADANAIQDFLVNQLKVSPDNIINLRDAEATKQGILNAFEQLEKKSAATVDPCIIIYYAGHGASSPRPQGWEDWATDREWIEQLCPSDLGAVVNGRVVEGIPDRVICGLLNSLAEKRGNNIVSFVSLDFNVETRPY